MIFSFNLHRQYIKEDIHLEKNELDNHITTLKEKAGEIAEEAKEEYP